MKSRFVLMPAVFAAAAAFGAADHGRSESLDAQAHAAALLSRPHAPSASSAHVPIDGSSSTDSDAHTRAAALLSGRIDREQAARSIRNDQDPARRVQRDAQAHAAALLSGSRAELREPSRITSIAEPSGTHPAVLVAAQWSTRGIDSNRFIVAPPASLRWVDGSQTD